MKLRKSKSLTAILFSLAMSIPLTVQATVVEVRTVLGDFQVNLFDQTTPETVENFLQYVNSGAYANNVVHRSVPGFVMQAGGFNYSNVFPPGSLQTGSPVINEPVLSNLRGTVAMAKVGGNPNSATSQWFVNVNNNAAILDPQNGGFTVFGQVLGDGMDVVDAIMTLPRFSYSGAFGEIPLQNFTSADIELGNVPNENNLVIITDIVVVDATVVTNADLNPARNTSVSSGGGGDSGGSSGGSMGFLLVSLLTALGFARRFKKA